MKKLIALLLFIILAVPAIALADLPDISGLNYKELVQLKEQINLAIWNSQEWQEVTVPEGTYKIGESIPAGHWTLRVAGHGCFYIYYFDKPDATGKKFGYGSQRINQQIASEDFHAFEQEYCTEYDIEMKDGWYIYLGGKTIFTPYAGGPDLGFK